MQKILLETILPSNDNFCMRKNTSSLFSGNKIAYDGYNHFTLLRNYYGTPHFPFMSIAGLA